MAPASGAPAGNGGRASGLLIGRPATNPGGRAGSRGPGGRRGSTGERAERSRGNGARPHPSGGPGRGQTLGLNWSRNGPGSHPTRVPRPSLALPRAPFPGEIGSTYWTEPRSRLWACGLLGAFSLLSATGLWRLGHPPAEPRPWTLGCFWGLLAVPCVTFPELADCPPPGCAATALPVSLKGSWQLLLAAARVLDRKSRPEGCLVARKLTPVRLPCWNSPPLVLPDPTPARMLPDKAELLLSVTN